ncbi:MAG: MOSC domain-containing protein [Actinobacteria bacterium]|nr:MOSC domain-containing protein [Actinomycetota bacterium]
MEPRVVSVNVGRPRTTEWHGRQVTSGIWKAPVVGRVAARGVNLEGDDQADRRVHGGDGKAVYAYSVEDYAAWSTDLELAEPLAPATFGENLTTSGLVLQECRVGDRWTISDTVLEVVQPRFPCFKLGMRMGDAGFVDRFRGGHRPGVYFRIVTPGTVGAGDVITVATTRFPDAPTVLALFDA